MFQNSFNHQKGFETFFVTSFCHPIHLPLRRTLVHFSLQHQKVIETFLTNPPIHYSIIATITTNP
jgi:hypothetical protein